jgi:hypothetical protein
MVLLFGLVGSAIQTVEHCLQFRCRNTLRIQATRGLLAGRFRGPWPSKSNTYPCSFVPEAVAPTPPAPPSPAISSSLLRCAMPTATPFRISGNVGRSSLLMARGLSSHQASASAAYLLLLLPSASAAVHRARGSHFSKPRRKATVPGDEFARNLRSMLSARPAARESRRHRMSSGHGRECCHVVGGWRAEKLNGK